jgi:rare lipoprotein A
MILKKNKVVFGSLVLAISLSTSSMPDQAYARLKTLKHSISTLQSNATATAGDSVQEQPLPESSPLASETFTPAGNSVMVAVGKASYYGNRFHGKKTAAGERFDKMDFTAAHRTLPFGTIVQVTNLRNGKKVIVTINDRGPLNKNRIIDLSKAAAKELDMVNSGVGKVRIEAWN